MPLSGFYYFICDSVIDECNYKDACANYPVIAHPPVRLQCKRTCAIMQGIRVYKSFHNRGMCAYPPVAQISIFREHFVQVGRINSDESPNSFNR